MTAATAISSILAFIVALWAFGIVRVCSQAVSTGRRALDVMQDESLDDEAREKAVQQASLRLLTTFSSIALRGVMALAFSCAPIWLAALAGLTTVADVTDYLARWDVIVIATVAVTIGYVIWNRMWPSS